jgi:hypothetical protein
MTEALMLARNPRPGVSFLDGGTLVFEAVGAFI